MRIAVDGSELSGAPTGMGRYLGALLHQWMALNDDDSTFTVYVRDDRGLNLPDSHRLRVLPLGSGSIKSTVYWQQVVLARELRRDPPDVVFAPADAAPLRFRGPIVNTVHDLSYFARPEGFDLKQGARRRWLTKKSVAAANRVVAVSEFTRQELMRHLDVDGDKVAVVHHGRDPRLDNVVPTPEAILRRQLRQDGPFALVVGSLFERRHPQTVLEAFRLLGDLDLGLVLAGADRRRNGGDLQEVIQSLGLADRVTWADYCKEADLVGLYRCADHLIYVSDYEGFGLPPLEGMGFDLPALVAGCPALTEVYGDSVHGVTALNGVAIAEGIRALATDTALRETLIGRGHALVARLGAKTCADRTLAELHAAGKAGTPA